MTGGGEVDDEASGCTTSMSRERARGSNDSGVAKEKHEQAHWDV